MKTAKIRYQVITYTSDGLWTLGRKRATLDLANQEVAKILKADPSLVVEILEVAGK